MDESNLGIFNKLRIIGPAIFFVVVLAVLYKFTELGLAASFAIAAVIALVDYYVLSWLMTRVASADQD